jgi:hypothetical protein
MPRKLKPYKVDTVSHSNGLRADIMLDRETKKFFAKLEGDVYESDTAAGVKSQLWDAMASWEPPKWEQIILIDLSHYDYDNTWGGALQRGAHIEFSFDRREVSKTASSNPIWRPFLPRGEKFGERDPEDWELKRRKENSDWQYTAASSGCRRIPYDEAVWQVLLQLKNHTDTIGERLSKILGGGADPKLLKKLGKQLVKQLKG